MQRQKRETKNFNPLVADSTSLVYSQRIGLWRAPIFSTVAMNIIKTGISLLSAVVAFTAGSYAGMVDGQADDRNGFSLANGVDLPKGSLIRIGFFNLSDVAIQSATMPFLEQNFIEFGVAHIGDPLDSYPAGHFDRAIIGNADAMGIAGKQIYMWVLAATDNSSSARSIATAYQQGVVYMDKTMNPAWSFRAEGDIPNSTIVDVADLTRASDLLIPGAHVVIGKFDATSGTSDVTGGRNFALVALIPEPSSALLALAGAMAVLTRRRRLL